MIQLGLGFQVTQNGNNGPKLINEGPWSKHITDLRDMLSVLHAKGICCYNIPIVFSYSSEGMFITLLREIKGRQKDNTSAFIYVPKQTEISAEELYNVVTKVKMELGKSSINLPELKLLFDKEYAEKKLYLDYQESAQSGYAFRRIPDKYSLKELLGDERYQKYYTPFKYVFLFEEEDLASDVVGGDCGNANGEDFTDLTQKELESYCSIIPPSDKEISSVYNDQLKIMTANGEPFSEMIAGVKGEPIEFILERCGFLKKNVSISLKSLGEKFDVNLLKKLQWEKFVSPKNFMLTDVDTQKRVDGCRIFINDQEVGRSGVLIEEGKCNHVHVTIEHQDYEKECLTVNFLKNESVTIQLVRKDITYHYPIRLKNNEKGEVSFSSKRKYQNYQSPIKHYEVAQGVLMYDRESEKKMKLRAALIGFGAGALLVLLIWAGFSLCTDSGNSKTHERTRTRPDYENYQPEKESKGGKEDDVQLEDDTLQEDDTTLEDRTSSIDYDTKGNGDKRRKSVNTPGTGKVKEKDSKKDVNQDTTEKEKQNQHSNEQKH